MDAIVLAALKKWPAVPACRGWLGLDARGDWYMRDDRVQAAGPFPQVKGSRLLHDRLIEFIGRNYEADPASGEWFFQNGPQRVYVELEAAPWVWRVDGAGAPRRRAAPGSTSMGGCSSTATSASAWSTRWTCTRPSASSRAARGSRSLCPSQRWPSASATC
jgi:Protein of unknown function (DUF2946)